MEQFLCLMLLLTTNYQHISLHFSIIFEKKENPTLMDCALPKACQLSRNFISLVLMLSPYECTTLTLRFYFFTLLSFPDDLYSFSYMGIYFCHHTLCLLHQHWTIAICEKWLALHATRHINSQPYLHHSHAHSRNTDNQTPHVCQ